MKQEITIRGSKRTGEFRLSVLLGIVALGAYLVALSLLLVLAAASLDLGLIEQLPIGCVLLGFLANFGGFVTACLALGTERDRKLGCLLPLGLNVVPPFLAFALVMPTPPL